MQSEMCIHLGGLAWRCKLEEFVWLTGSCLTLVVDAVMCRRGFADECQFVRVRWMKHKLASHVSWLQKAFQLPRPKPVRQLMVSAKSSRMYP
ncbi:hypothetical protein LY78DRAFT_288462 [Colletotrichum sublineola]|nr:hypothetical protein LY78DRAFT_288462 [Colletotrichum sublineola]